MKTFNILLVFLACTAECKQIPENVVDREESAAESARNPMQTRSSYVMHPYIEGDFYADISGLDLAPKLYSGPDGLRQGDMLSISVIETNTSSCVKSQGVVGLEFQLPLSSLTKDLTYSELVVELENSEDAVSLLSSYVLWGEERNGESKTGQPRVRNSWLIYDVNDIIKAFTANDQRGKSLRLSVHLVAETLNRNAAGSGVEFDACRFYSRRPPTMFLYHDFPAELSQRLLRASRVRLNPIHRPVETDPQSDDRTGCRLHTKIYDVSHNETQNYIINPFHQEFTYCYGVCNRTSCSHSDIRRRFQYGRVTNPTRIDEFLHKMAMELPALNCLTDRFETVHKSKLYHRGRDTIVVQSFSQITTASCMCASNQ